MEISLGNKNFHKIKGKLHFKFVFSAKPTYISNFYTRNYWIRNDFWYFYKILSLWKTWFLTNFHCVRGNVTLENDRKIWENHFRNSRKSPQSTRSENHPLENSPDCWGKVWRATSGSMFILHFPLTLRWIRGMFWF